MRYPRRRTPEVVLDRSGRLHGDIKERPRRTANCRPTTQRTTQRAEADSLLWFGDHVLPSRLCQIYGTQIRRPTAHQGGAFVVGLRHWPTTSEIDTSKRHREPVRGMCSDASASALQPDRYADVSRETLFRSVMACLELDRT